MGSEKIKQSRRRQSALGRALALAACWGMASPVLRAASTTSLLLHTSEGRVNFYKHTGPSDDTYTSNPTAAVIQFMNTYWVRLLTFTGYWDQNNKLSWYSNAWAYFDSYAVYSDPSDTFWAQIVQQHPDWILRDNQGNPVYIAWECSGGTCPQYAANITNPNGYRAFWISQAQLYLNRSLPYKGLWIDDVNLDLSRVSDGNGNPVVVIDPNTGQAMTNEAWMSYFADYMAQVRAAFASAELVHNSLWFLDWTDPNIQREIQAADWINLERGVNDPGLTGGTGYWSLNRLFSFIDNVHANGKGVILDGEAWVGSNSDPAREYSVACYLLISTGSDMVGDSSQTPSYWWNGFTTDLGKAQSGRYSWQNLLRRDFAGGIALVNPPGSASVTFTLPQPLRRTDGTVVSTLTLTAASGAVLSSMGGTAGTVSGIACNPVSLSAGASSVCTVTLNQAVPSGGVPVALSSSSPSLTVPASAMVAAGTSTATFTATAGTITTNQTANVTASFGGTSQTAAISLVSQVTLSSMMCVPTSLSGGGTATCSVNLSGGAPPGGSTIALSSNNGSLTVPASILVAAGTTSNTFTTTAGTVPSNQNAVVTATYNASSEQANFTLTPASAFTSLGCTLTSLASSGVSTCTITLSSPAPAGGATVSLSSNNALLTVPASVTVAAGATTNTFSATAGIITSSQSATVTATYGSGSQQIILSLTQPAVLSSIGCAATSLGIGASSTCTVTLSSPAPSGGANVALSSSTELLTVPASVTVAAGTTTATFSAIAGNVNNAQSAAVTATYGSSSQQITLSLLSQFTILSVGCSPGSLVTNQTATCTVTLSAPAPSGGVSVILSSDNPQLPVPAFITVPTGMSVGTFTATAGTFSSTQTANISVTYSGSSQSTYITLVGQATLSSITCPVASLNGGGVAICSVSLTSPAPASGTLVNLATSNAALSVPASATVSAGASVATFAATAGSVTASQMIVITATLNGIALTVSLNVLPPQTVITQNSGNSMISGNYYVRQVSLGTDTHGNLVDPRSVIGTITFDGAGNYSFTGQSAQNGAAVPQTANGVYVADTAGMVSLDSLVRSGEKINARFSSEAIIGSTTESTTAFDLFVAIPAPNASTNNGFLTGSYPTATLEFPTGGFATVRNAFIALSSAGDGTFQSVGVTGHAANHASGQLVTEGISGATYTMSNNGIGSIDFGSASSVVSGTKTIYLSQNGDVLLGGTANSYDVLIGIRGSAQSVTNASWAGPFWGAGLRIGPTAVKSFAGAVVASGSGSLYWTRRIKASGSPNMDSTEVDPYFLQGSGSGTSQLTHVTLGGSGNLFLGTSINSSDANGYEIYVGTRMPPASGSGLYLNPQGVQNVASYAPTGNPIAPGELIYLYVSGLTVTPQTATSPYPLSLGGVTVLINGNPAPLYLVSSTQLVAVVPYATEGPGASIVVQANGLRSNTVVVPVAATAPGVFSQLENGSGLGAIRHSDYSVVTDANPAHSGEVVLIYLTGLGSITPPLADGVGGSANSLSLTNVTPTVMVGSSPAQVLFSGMSAYPGLYQINAQLPTIPAGSSTTPVVITTPNAFHDQVDIAVAP